MALQLPTVKGHLPANPVAVPLTASYEYQQTGFLFSKTISSPAK